MQKVSANPQAIRKNAASYEKITVKTMILTGVLLVLTYICMAMPLITSKKIVTAGDRFKVSLIPNLFSKGMNVEAVLAIVAAVLVLAAVVVIFINPNKNRKLLAISAGMNGAAIVLLLFTTIRLGTQPLASGETFSFAVAALTLLFPAAILYLNIFQYIKGYGKYGLTFALPFFIVFAIFQLYPIIFTFRTSVTDAVGWAKVLDNDIIGLKNFARLFDGSDIISKEFWLSLWNTVVMWMFNFVPQISMALMLASWFTDTRMRLKFQGGFKVMIFMPNIITAATIGMLFMSLFNYPIAPVNTMLQNLGLLHQPFEFFRNMYVSRGIVSFIQWWMWYGNTMIVMIAGILGINPSLFEAALVDGCSSRQTFWKITLPLIKPILLYNLVTSLVGGLTMFDIPHMMTQGAPDNTTNTVARFIYNQGFTGANNFSMASAASVVLFIIIVICSLILSAIMKDREPKKRRAVK